MTGLLPDSADDIDGWRGSTLERPAKSISQTSPDGPIDIRTGNRQVVVRSMLFLAGTFAALFEQKTPSSDTSVDSIILSIGRLLLSRWA